MGSITFQLMVITIISKFTGLIREVSFAKFFGTGMITDIYVVSESITAMAFSFLFMSIQTTFIPMYNKVLTNSGRSGRKVRPSRAFHAHCSLPHPFLGA